MNEREDGGRVVTSCDECRSLYFADSSKMRPLCSECSHRLYGYLSCEHEFMVANAGKQCTRCGWDGARSEYLRALGLR